MIKVNPEVHDLERKKAVKEMERLNMAKLEFHTEKLANGEELKFKFQSNGYRETLRMISRTKDDLSKRTDELLENTIFFEDGAKVTYEFFEELPKEAKGFKAMNNVVGAAMNFLIETDGDEK